MVTVQNQQQRGIGRGTQNPRRLRSPIEDDPEAACQAVLPMLKVHFCAGRGEPCAVLYLKILIIGRSKKSSASEHGKILSDRSQPTHKLDQATAMFVDIRPIKPRYGCTQRPKSPQCPHHADARPSL